MATTNPACRFPGAVAADDWDGNDPPERIISFGGHERQRLPPKSRPANAAE